MLCWLPLPWLLRLRILRMVCGGVRHDVRFFSLVAAGFRRLVLATLQFEIPP